MKHLTCVLLTLCLITLEARGEPSEPNFEITNNDGVVRVLTHGEVVWGNQFGLILGPNNCNSNRLWLSISSYEDDLEMLEGRTVNFTWTVDDQSFPVELDVTYVVRLTKTIQIVLFNGIELLPEFVNFLHQSERLQMVINGPELEASKFDIPEESFSLIGFKESYFEAVKSCQANSEN
ncbi:hypothetical protein [Marinobacterium sp. xm-d-530]|uniref:hypothetical protein n=1 Tax=Marinobacterium sp. xm-d-530 TaxID=2497747 RepID=UPI001567C754|nr:hypothetical protein [Marinobacterium sp. xm-d-530]NRQ00824.1 hypothetical protein [Marinobacterium sp. xm-d-530]